MIRIRSKWRKGKHRGGLKLFTNPHYNARKCWGAKHSRIGKLKGAQRHHRWGKRGKSVDRGSWARGLLDRNAEKEL